MKAFRTKFSKERFLLQEVMSSDDSCFRYTGVPNRKTLRGKFKWVKSLVKTSSYGTGRGKFHQRENKGEEEPNLPEPSRTYPFRGIFADTDMDSKRI